MGTRSMLRPAGLVLAVILSSACEPVPDPARLEQAQTVCADGATLPGIDVSKWQGQIDWDQVAAAGVRFAFIRASHGLGELDDQFARNWSEAKRVGIVRGAYQYLEPADDPAAQAQLLVDTMGPLDPSDLPPVLDVEKQGQKTPTQLAAAVGTWLDAVQAAVGRRPIVYTSPSFWTTAVGAPSAYGDHALWIANYNVSCPDVPGPWARWDFWQKSSKGSIGGISGDVDLDLFNGDAIALAGFVDRSSVCGDGVCEGNESAAACAADCASCVLPEAGGQVDDHGACFARTGKETSWRSESAGEGGALRWTYAWDQPDQNVGTWVLELAAAGAYLVEVHTPAPFGGSKQARYLVRHAGQEDAVTLDQSAADGWQTLGTFSFAAGPDQRVRLGDSTGEAYALRRQLVFDDLRLTRVGDAPDGMDVPDGGVGPGGDAGTGPQPDGGGCAMAPRPTPASLGGVLALLLALAVRRRRAAA